MYNFIVVSLVLIIFLTSVVKVSIMFSNGSKNLSCIVPCLVHYFTLWFFKSNNLRSHLNVGLPISRISTSFPSLQIWNIPTNPARQIYCNLIILSLPWLKITFANVIILSGVSLSIWKVASQSSKINFPKEGIF